MKKGMKEVESLRFCNMGLDDTLQMLPAIAVAPSQEHCTFTENLQMFLGRQQPCNI